MRKSIPVNWIGQKNEGYIVNAGFSDENTKKIQELMNELEEKFGSALFLPEPHTLHITLLDWIKPLTNYEVKDKKVLFGSIKNKYDQQLTKILKDYDPINVLIDEIEIHPTTIILKGKDDGTFQEIRDRFVGSIGDGFLGMEPPKIIHTSIARFKKEIDLAEVEKIISTRKMKFTERVETFRLLNSHETPFINFDLIKSYKL